MRMGFVDRAWLRMDDRTNPMVITGLLLFAGGLPVEALRAVLRERLTHPRFRSVARAAGPLGAWSTWDLVPAFDPATRVVEVALGPDEDALRALVSGWMGVPLEPAAPRWRVVHVDRGAAGAAVVVQVHHAVGDGVTLVRTLLDVAGGGAARPVAGVEAPRPTSLRAHAARAWGDLRALVRLLALPHEPGTSLRPPLSGRKRLAWTAPLSVEALQRRAHEGGVTLTDVVVGAFAGALADEHLRVTGAPLSSARALVPVFRHGGDAASVNRFGLVFLTLPLGGSAQARVRSVHEELRALRAAPDTEVALGVLGALGLSPRPVERVGVALFTGKASVLITSVPGPRDRLTLGGREVTGVIVSAPVAGTVGMSASILSVGPEVRVSVATDAALPHDPGRLVRAIEDAVRA
jgi:diacylglycerol O-acyltransferase